MSKNLNFYPEEIRDIISLKVLPLERILDCYKQLKTKKRVEFTCEICGKINSIRFDKISNRIYGAMKPICSSCIMKWTTNQEKWRQVNSDAQYIAQNKPETILKQQDAQRKLQDSDPNYVLKRRCKSFVSGNIENIYFDSSWELFYILFCLEDSNVISIKRCKDKILYYSKDGIEKAYFPDFDVLFTNEQEIIVEIKGNINNNFELKIEAAIERYGNNFILLKLKDLQKMGIYPKSESWIRDEMNKIKDKYVISFDNNQVCNNWKEKYFS